MKPVVIDFLLVGATSQGTQPTTEKLEAVSAGGAQVSPTPSTRDRILGVRGGPDAPPGNVRRRHRNANAEEDMQYGRWK